MYNLHMGLLDPSVAVLFTCLNGLLRYDWEIFAQPFYQADVWPPTCSSKRVIDVVIQKLTTYLDINQPPPYLHATFRVIKLLGEKFLLSNELETIQKRDVRMSYVNVNPMYPLYPLMRKLLELSKYLKGFTKLMLLQALIWLTYESSPMSENPLQETISEMNNLPSELFDRILEELLRRVQNSPGMASTALHLILCIFKTNPWKVNPEMLLDMWTSVMDFGVSGRFKVINNIFDLLAIDHKHAQNKEQIIHIRRVCYWALGHFATKLSQDSLGARSPLGSISLNAKKFKDEGLRKKATASRGRRVSSKSRVDEEENNTALSMQTSNGKKSCRTGCNSIGRSSKYFRSPRSKHDTSFYEKRRTNRRNPTAPMERVQWSEKIFLQNTEDLVTWSRFVEPGNMISLVPNNSLPGGVSVPPLTNPFMTIILQRLEFAICSSTWDEQIICLEALATISFCCDFEVKLHLYSFFLTLVKEDETGLSTEIAPILPILQTVFEAFEAHAEMGVPLSEEDRLKLLAQMRNYCDLPDNFNPIGVSV
eukprot:TRINITY_DN168_c2_g1_i2.p1 TRINITY_DN168_c2_g1~~TRINITY_DN168_c2_g1_i2.p1  ORF type:complete len:619 (-),score=104.09 TRINITY_DN168_c2_g1_i2:145-1752(-)